MLNNFTGTKISEEFQNIAPGFVLPGNFLDETVIPNSLLRSRFDFLKSTNLIDHVSKKLAEKAYNAEPKSVAIANNANPETVVQYWPNKQGALATIIAWVVTKSAPTVAIVYACNNNEQVKSIYRLYSSGKLNRIVWYFTFALEELSRFVANEFSENSLKSEIQKLSQVRQASIPQVSQSAPNQVLPWARWDSNLSNQPSIATPISSSSQQPLAKSAEPVINLVSPQAQPSHGSNDSNTQTVPATNIDSQRSVTNPALVRGTLTNSGSNSASKGDEDKNKPGDKNEAIPLLQPPEEAKCCRLI